MKQLYLLLLLPLIYCSCHKHGLNPDNGCISRITKQYHLSTADTNLVIALFQANDLSMANLEFYEVQHDSASLNYGYINVMAYAVKNGLPVYDPVTFSFKDGLIYFNSGFPSVITSLSATPATPLVNIRKVFLEQAPAYGDSCLVAQLMYYQMPMTQNGPLTYSRGWLVNAAHSSYPLALIDDTDTKLVYFWKSPPVLVPGPK